jgi:dimethylamine corrinoid protein
MAIVELRRDDVLREIEERINAGGDPVAVINECAAGMRTIGDRFGAGDAFLAELILAGQIFADATSLLDLQRRAGENGEQRHHSRVVLATPKGDVHDIGKNILAMMLRTYGFEVHDLGVDVEPRLIVEKVAELQPEFLGLSILLTTAIEPAKRVAHSLSDAGVRAGCKLMIGGGVTTQLAKGYVGADFQTTDVMQGVHYCLSNSSNEI